MKRFDGERQREAGRARGAPVGLSGRQPWLCRIDVTESLTRWRKGLIVRAGPPQRSTAEFEHQMGLRKEVRHRYCSGAASTVPVGATVHSVPASLTVRKAPASAPLRRHFCGEACHERIVKSIDGVLPPLGPGAVHIAPGPLTALRKVILG